MAVTPPGATVPDAVNQLRAVLRTCIGCRQRETATELLRVVVDPAARTESGTPDPVVRVVPDPRRRAPGRGAWLHPTEDCVALALRRKAFARALRCAVPIDAEPVVYYVANSVKTSARPRPEDSPA